MPQTSQSVTPQPAQAEKTLAYVQLKKGNNKVYMQGVISLVIFAMSLVIAVFLYVPFIQSTAEVAKKVAVVEEEVASLDKKYKAINSYDRDELASQLQLVSYYIPNNIRVATLATFINSNAVKYGLTVARLGINEDKAEVKQSVAEKEKQKLLGSAKTEKQIFLGRVEGPFSFSGSRDKIFKFLDFLVLGGYATNFDQVSIVAAGTDTWTVNFFAVYYYLEPLESVEPGRQYVVIQKELLSALSPPSTEPIDLPDVTPSPSITPTVTQQ